MKKLLNTAGRIIDAVSGFFGGLILAILIIMVASTSLRILDTSIPYCHLAYLLIACVLPFIGAKWHYKFVRFFAALFTFFASDDGGGHMGGDTHDRWRDLLMDIMYLVAVVLTIVAFFFSARIPLLSSTVMLFTYAIYVMREKNTQSEITTDSTVPSEGAPSDVQ